MKKYILNPFDLLQDANDFESISRELTFLKRSYNRCDDHIHDMRFTDDGKGSPVEIHLYVNLRKAIQDVITALDDIETCRRHLYGEN